MIEVYDSELDASIDIYVQLLESVGQVQAAQRLSVSAPESSSVSWSLFSFRSSPVIRAVRLFEIAHH